MTPEVPQHILAIDDNRADLELIEMGLTEMEEPIRLSQGDSGSGALALLETLHAERSCPDLILLDLNMPRVSGFQVLATIRERGICPRTRIVIMTTSSSRSDRERCLALGASRFVTKPASFEDLIKTLRDAIRVVPE